MVKLSICIVNYNTRDWLNRCLASIQNTAGDIEYEIIVVDNGSTDGSVELVQAEYPTLTLIILEENTFYSEGNNIAIRASQGDYILVLNPDTEIHRGALQALNQALDDNASWGAVTAQQLWIDGKTTLPICSQFNSYVDLWLGNTFMRVLLAPWRNKRRSVMWYANWNRLTHKSVDVIPGSCMLIRREILEQVGAFTPQSGAFDSQMPMYFSDDDLCRRIKTDGWAIWYIANAVITHVESASVSQVSNIAKQHYIDDMAVYAQKYHGAVRAYPLMIAARLTGWLQQKLGR